MIFFMFCLWKFCYYYVFLYQDLTITERWQLPLCRGQLQDKRQKKNKDYKHLHPLITTTKSLLGTPGEVQPDRLSQVTLGPSTRLHRFQRISIGDTQSPLVQRRKCGFTHTLSFILSYQLHAYTHTHTHPPAPCKPISLSIHAL